MRKKKTALGAAVAMTLPTLLRPRPPRPHARRGEDLSKLERHRCRRQNLDSVCKRKRINSSVRALRPLYFPGCSYRQQCSISFYPANAFSTLVRIPRCPPLPGCACVFVVRIAKVRAIRHRLEGHKREFFSCSCVCSCVRTSVSKVSLCT